MDDYRFRLIKTFGILSVINEGMDGMCDSLRSGHIGFVVRGGECYVFNVTVATLSYYASQSGIRSFVYYDGECKYYRQIKGRHYDQSAECPAVTIPMDLFREVDSRLAENLKQFDDPSAALDFIIARVGIHPYYMRAKINKGINLI